MCLTSTHFFRQKNDVSAFKIIKILVKNEIPLNNKMVNIMNFASETSGNPIDIHRYIYEVISNIFTGAPLSQCPLLITPVVKGVCN